MTLSLFDIAAWLIQATAKGSVAIALLAVASILIGRRVRARFWYALWLLIALRLIVPVAPASTWSIFNLVPPHPGVQLQLRGMAGQIVIDSVSNAIAVPWWIAAWKWLVVVWLCGFAVVVARVFVATVRTQSLVLRALQSGGATPAAWRIAEQGRAQLGIRQQVTVIESPLVSVPALHGFIHPTLLLPEGMCAAFAAEQLRHIILHELAHVRRYDVAFNWILNAVRAIHWFNPLAWFAAARIEEERELACDELTLTCLEPDERLAYGRTILKLLERFRSAAPAPALVGIVNRKQQMRRRLTMITGNAHDSRLMLPLVAALSAIALMAFTDAPTRKGARLDPVALLTLQRFEQRIDVDVTDAPLSELVGIVTAKSGVAVTQSPAVAASGLQRARFTLHAHDAPARAVLSGALQPYGIVPLPEANGIQLTTGPPCLRQPHRN